MGKYNYEEEKKCTLGPLGPLLHRGVLVVWQSEQTLTVILLWFDEVLLLLSVDSVPSGDDGCFGSSNLNLELPAMSEPV